jgi:hypothetical protein
MAEDKYKVDKTKPPKPIQLKDASGIHELSDERNYEFLNKLFEMKELDPFAKEAYDVNVVYQLMDPKGKKSTVKGFYTPKEHPTGTSKYMSGIPEWKEDFKDTLQRKGDRVYKKYGHGPREGPDRKIKERDVVAVLGDAWNTEQGMDTLMHEFRHRAFRNNPDYMDIIKDTKIGVKEFSSGKKYSKEEIINRAFDAIYLKNSSAMDLLKAMKFSRRELNELRKAVNDLVKSVETK